MYWNWNQFGTNANSINIFHFSPFKQFYDSIQSKIVMFVPVLCSFHPIIILTDKKSRNLQWAIIERNFFYISRNIHASSVCNKVGKSWDLFGIQICNHKVQQYRIDCWCFHAGRKKNPNIFWVSEVLNPYDNKSQ